MRGLRHSHGRTIAFWGMAVLLVLTAGCSKSDKVAAGSQVVARVNDGEISIHQLQALMQSQPALVAQWGDAASTKLLDSLIEQELAAQAARKEGLDKSPKVLQAMELAKREVLARAYQDQLADKVVQPDTESVTRYYNEHPELFVNRKRYSLLETSVRAASEQVPALQQAVLAAEGVPALQAALAGLPQSSRSVVQLADEIPLNWLPTLAALPLGRSMVLPRADGLVVLTVLKTEDAPLTKQETTRAISAALMSERRRELVQAGMANLRQQAKVERMTPAASQASPSARTAASSAN